MLELREVDLFYTALALFLLIDGGLFVAEGLRFEKRSRRLKKDHNSKIGIPPTLPKVSVVLAALNEEEDLPKCLASLAAQDVEGLEVILVNDRSTDRSGEIMQSFAGAHPNWKYIEIKELPEGWLGKPHALHQGSLKTTGEYIIFTDADVKFEPPACREILGIAIQNDFDHLCAGPQFTAQDPILKSMLLVFTSSLVRLLKPSRMGLSPHSYIGVGAFNLVRKKSYKELGGHEKLRLSVLDDIMLSKLFAQAGKNHFFMEGKAFLSLDWYPNALAMIRGLGKNGFAAMRYSWINVFAMLALTLLTYILPYLGLIYATGFAWKFLLTVLVVNTSVNAYFAYKISYSPLYALAMPLASLCIAYAHIRSATIASLRGYVSWRETRYTLKSLRDFSKSSGL